MKLKIINRVFVLFWQTKTNRYSLSCGGAWVLWCRFTDCCGDKYWEFGPFQLCKEEPYDDFI